MNHQSDPSPARARWLPLWQAALIAATGAMLMAKVASGTLALYVHPRYTPLIFGTGALLLLLALLQAWFTLRAASDSHDHDHGARSWRSPTMLALLVPVALGLLVPARALGTSAIDNRGFGAGGGMRSVQSIAGTDAALGIPDPASWTMLDWVNALTYEPDNPRLQGQPIQVTGFVWRSEQAASEQFVLSRFVVSCCTADSLALGMTVIWPDAATLQNDGWVRVAGTIGLEERDGRQEAVILADEVSSIEQPAEPYLYP